MEHSFLNSTFSNISSAVRECQELWEMYWPGLTSWALNGPRLGNPYCLENPVPLSIPVGIQFWKFWHRMIAGWENLSVFLNSPHYRVMVSHEATLCCWGLWSWVETHTRLEMPRTYITCSLFLMEESRLRKSRATVFHSVA